MRGRGRRVLGMQVLGRDEAKGFVALDGLLTKVAASHSWNGGGEELRLGQKWEEPRDIEFVLIFQLHKPEIELITKINFITMNLRSKLQPKILVSVT
jgi:hypothetical protein